MIEPFEPAQVRKPTMIELFSGAKVCGAPVISYGLSSAGYDIRASHTWWRFKREPWWRRCGGGRGAIDPKLFNVGRCVEQARITSTPAGDVFEMPPHSYAMTHSVETFHVPDDVIGVCVGKSTYARCGLVVNDTPLEPGWSGVLVIEVANTTPRPLLVYCGEGIAQVLFHRIAKPSVSYADRAGKYQGQRGLTPAKV